MKPFSLLLAQEVFARYLANIDDTPRWFGHEFMSGEWFNGKDAVGAERIARLRSITVSERFLLWERPTDLHGVGALHF